MKIIQVIPEFGLAGAETMCENLTNALLKLGHSVIVISLYDYHSPITDRLEANHIKLEYLGKKNGLDFGVIKRLREVFVRERPDVIHSHLYLLKYCVLAAINMNVRLVHTVHNIAKKENGKADRIFNGVFYKRGKVIPVALTELVKDSIITEYGISSDRVPTVFNGIPLERCIKKKSYLIGGRIKILHIGRYSDAKNHLEMIAAIVKLHQSFPGLELHLFGEGYLKTKVAQTIREYGAGEYIIEHGTTSNPYAYLSDADIFILPSVYEGMPMTLIEAMGTALPIVASSVGGIPDMIHDRVDGLLCQPNSESIAARIRILLENQGLRERLGKTAFESAKRFSAEEMAIKYLSVYTGTF